MDRYMFIHTIKLLTYMKWGALDIDRYIQNVDLLTRTGTYIKNV